MMMCLCGHDVTEHADNDGKCFGTATLTKGENGWDERVTMSHPCTCTEYIPDTNETHVTVGGFFGPHLVEDNDDQPRRNETLCSKCFLLHAGECL